MSLAQQNFWPFANQCSTATCLEAHHVILRLALFHSKSSTIHTFWKWNWASQWGFCWVNTAWEYIPSFWILNPPINSTSRPPYINGILSFHRRFSVISIGPQERSNSEISPSAQRVGGSVGFLGKPQRRIGTAKAYTGRPEDVSWEVIKKKIEGKQSETCHVILLGFFWVRTKSVWEKI